MTKIIPNIFWIENWDFKRITITITHKKQRKNGAVVTVALDLHRTWPSMAVLCGTRGSYQRPPFLEATVWEKCGVPFFVKKNRKEQPKKYCRQTNAWHKWNLVFLLLVSKRPFLRFLRCVWSCFLIFPVFRFADSIERPWPEKKKKKKKKKKKLVQDYVRNLGTRNDQFMKRRVKYGKISFQTNHFLCFRCWQLDDLLPLCDVLFCSLAFFDP